ncbi:hypothetical protein T265_01482 [Opisthorchis viverrini]|uniref:Uncharacterized protein n=1 Tax=Opisthorchis viverrini TaxID=6198 RepID=A0A075A2E4_OPIVI|nr:hypothetical protein T265_01482 [Opisthorchis viverrini]KER32427.1 hypothetical protein T265_01482 [Opisthorchis viverrini]
MLEDLRMVDDVLLVQCGIATAAALCQRHSDKQPNLENAPVPELCGSLSTDKKLSHDVIRKATVT